MPELAQRGIQPTLLKWAWIGVAFTVIGTPLLSTLVSIYCSTYHPSVASAASSFVLEAMLVVSAVTALIALLCFLSSFTKLSRFFGGFATLAVTLLIAFALFWMNAWNSASFH